MSERGCITISQEVLLLMKSSGGLRTNGEQWVSISSKRYTERTKKSMFILALMKNTAKKPVRNYHRFGIEWSTLLKLTYNNNRLEIYSETRDTELGLSICSSTYSGVFLLTNITNSLWRIHTTMISTTISIQSP